MTVQELQQRHLHIIDMAAGGMSYHQIADSLKLTLQIVTNALYTDLAKDRMREIKERANGTA